jgi:hypothetical protein
MEKRPFDGVIFELTGRTKEGKPCAVRPAFSREKWEQEWFQTSVDQLRAGKFTRLTDNFITIGANPGSVDWFDDEGWQQIVEHWRIAAWAAKQSGCKGLLFDPEGYTRRTRSSAMPPSRNGSSTASTSMPPRPASAAAR